MSQHDLMTDAEKIKWLIDAVAMIGVDFGFGEFQLSEEHIETARQIAKKMNADGIMHLSQRASRLEKALLIVTNELESWNLTEGDKDAAEAIKVGKDALAR